MDVPKLLEFGLTNVTSPFLQTCFSLTHFPLAPRILAGALAAAALTP